MNSTHGVNRMPRHFTVAFLETFGCCSELYPLKAPIEIPAARQTGSWHYLCKIRFDAAWIGFTVCLCFSDCPDS